MASNSDIRLGIVGMRLGMWHAGAIAEIDGVSIVAVADNVQGIMPGPNMTLQQFAVSHGADAYVDGVDMITNADIAAVDLCVSPKWRLPLVEAAAARGLPVLMEKPWGTNMAHGRSLADIINKANLLHMVEFPLRYFPPIVALKELLDDGPLGRPFVVNAEIVMGEAPAKMPQHWMWDPENGKRRHQRKHLSCFRYALLFAGESGITACFWRQLPRRVTHLGLMVSSRTFAMKAAQSPPSLAELWVRTICERQPGWMSIPRMGKR